MSRAVLETVLRNLAAWSVQVAVLAAVAAALSRLLPIERPPARLAFGQGLLILILALPLIQPWETSAAAVGWSITSLGSTAAASDAKAARSLPTPGWYPLVAGLLLLGFSVQLGRLGAGLARIRSLRHRSRALDVPPWLAALRDELAPRARFLVSDETATPATCGWRRPIVLLPTAFESMDRERQRAIAAHELVHARRGDWLLLLLEEALKTALFFHPAVHWLVGRVRLAREQTVDAAVVERLGARQVYLESLVEAARFGLRARAVPAARFLRESHLRERVDLLLKEVRMSRVRTHVNVGMTAAAVLLAVAWAVSAAPLQSTPTIGRAPTTDAARFARIDGVVQVKQPGSTEWVTATRALELPANALVRTGPGGNTQIRFADGTLLALRPDSLIRIDETNALVRTGPEGNAQVRLADGTLLALRPDSLIRLEVSQSQEAMRLQAGQAAVVPLAAPSEADDDKTASEPKVLHKVNPVYPEDAKADKVEGMFQLAVVVGKDGAVREARVVASSTTPGRLDDPTAQKGDARLAKAAVEAVQAWRYEPILKNGQPVEAKMTITINFKLS